MVLPRHTGSINLDALLNEPTGDHDVLTSAGPLPVEPESVSGDESLKAVENVSGFEAEDGEERDEDGEPQQAEDLTDKPDAGLNILEPSMRLKEQSKSMCS